MSAAWFTAAVPDAPVTVLKLRLRPYCLGHEILLTRLGSPFVNAERETRNAESESDLRAALLLAALVCSQTFEDACKSLHSPFLGLFLRFWRMRLRVATKATEGTKGSWSAELIRFVNYVRAGTWMPEVNPPKAGTGRALKSPWPFRLAAILMRELGLSESDALNMPMARASAYYAAIGDLEGTVDLFGPEDQALLDKVAELERAAAAT